MCTEYPTATKQLPQPLIDILKSRPCLHDFLDNEIPAGQQHDNQEDENVFTSASPVFITAINSILEIHKHNKHLNLLAITNTSPYFLTLSLDKNIEMKIPGSSIDSVTKVPFFILLHLDDPQIHNFLKRIIGDIHCDPGYCQLAIAKNRLTYTIDYLKTSILKGYCCAPMTWVYVYKIHYNSKIDIPEVTDDAL